MTSDPRNLAASVAARLLNQARATGRAYDELLTYYAIERFLFRLASTPHRERFVLKGALMLRLWGADLARTTRDIDLLDRGELSVDELARVIADCTSAPVPADGLVFDAATIRTVAIREQERYGGVRATFIGLLDRSRIAMQVDVGLGDVVTPGVVHIVYPTLLDLPAPELMGYPVETAIAEKLEAIVDLDLANSRMKDFFDLWSLLGYLEIDGDAIVAAVRATFARRGTALPTVLPVGLTPRFADDDAKRTQWSSFLRRIKVTRPTLGDAIARVASFALPVFVGGAADRYWDPEDGWAP
jgi:hypothetical protein